MSEIDIRVAHSIPPGRARKAAGRVAAQIGERYKLDCAWNGNTLTFTRQGVDGVLNLTPTEVTVRIRLGLLFSFLKPDIEKQLRHELNQVFGPPPAAAAKSTAAKRKR